MGSLRQICRTEKSNKFVKWSNHQQSINLMNTYIENRIQVMELHAFKNVNNCLNTNIYSYLETSGGQSYNPYLNAVYFFFQHQS